MIGQYLPQTNESATVAKSKIFSRLNKALFNFKNFYNFQISHYIESYGIYIVLNKNKNN